MKTKLAIWKRDPAAFINKVLTNPENGLLGGLVLATVTLAPKAVPAYNPPVAGLGKLQTDSGGAKGIARH